MYSTIDLRIPPITDESDRIRKDIVIKLIDSYISVTILSAISIL